MSEKALKFVVWVYVIFIMLGIFIGAINNI